ncbi:MAG: PEP-CTERM sorting domain-containing protein [Planctomycetales bacterium]|nr:PEP-CTERM sorting domain-containing protein [Planctomycetales bacterium]
MTTTAFARSARATRRARWLLLSAFLTGVSPALSWGGLNLDGGGLLLVQEGPAAATAGDPVPANLALNGMAFSSSELGPELGIGFHLTSNLNDGAYGNGFSWIGGDITDFVDAFAGVDLGVSPVSNIQSIAFGRSNVLAGDPCGVGICTDRHLGFYTLQYTQVPQPSDTLDLDTTQNALTGWVDIGTLDYGDSDGDGTNYNMTWQRHRYNFDPVSATGLRLIVPGTGLGGGTAIDEIEIYDIAGDFVPPPPPPPPPEPIILNAAAGFSLAWDGNNGDYFDSAAPPDGAVVPDNLALASNGGQAFTSSDLGPQLGIDFHQVDNINDGFYGNSNSWIGGDDNPFSPVQFAGVRLAEATSIGSIAWSRDNGNDLNDACGGQCTDRSTGLYTIQYTSVADPDADTPDTGSATTGWQTLGTVDYKFSDDDFTSYLRHQFEIGDENGNGLLATGIRLLVPQTGIGGGTAIDELELYAGGVVSIPGDVDGDGDCDVDDIDSLMSVMRTGVFDAKFDFTNDQVVDKDDLDRMIMEFKHTWFGDANLDGEFNTADFVQVFQIGEYEDGIAGNSTWAEGDWDANGEFDSGDFVVAFADGGFENGTRAAVAAVPEPASLSLFALGAGLLAGLRRRSPRT